MLRRVVWSAVREDRIIAAGDFCYSKLALGLHGTVHDYGGVVTDLIGGRDVRIVENDSDDPRSRAEQATVRAGPAVSAFGPHVPAAGGGRTP
jgi:hypothetical protein